MMQDEVSETENIRKNLSIERMIVEGCDILLDVNQTFVRQGTSITDPCRRLSHHVLRQTNSEQATRTTSSAVAENPRDASCH